MLHVRTLDIFWGWKLTIDKNYSLLFSIKLCPLFKFKIKRTILASELMAPFSFDMYPHFRNNFRTKFRTERLVSTEISWFLLKWVCFHWTCFICHYLTEWKLFFILPLPTWSSSLFPVFLQFLLVNHSYTNNFSRFYFYDEQNLVSSYSECIIWVVSPIKVTFYKQAAYLHFAIPAFLVVVLVTEWLKSTYCAIIWRRIVERWTSIISISKSQTFLFEIRAFYGCWFIPLASAKAAAHEVFKV